MSSIVYKFEDGNIDYNKIIMLGHGERLGFREEFKELYFNEVDPPVSLTINFITHGVFTTTTNTMFAIIPWDYLTRVELLRCRCGMNYDTDTMQAIR